MTIMIAVIAIELGILIYSILWIVGFMSEFKRMNTIEFMEEDSDNNE